MKNLKISKKLTVGFLIVIVLTLLVGAVGIFGMMQINYGSSYLYQRQTKPLVEVATAREYFQRLRSEQRNLVLATGDQAWIDTIAEAIALQDASVRERMWVFAEFIDDPGVQAAFNAAAEGFNSYMAQMDDILAASRRGLPQDQLIAMMRAATPAADAAAEGMTAMMEGRVDQATHVYTDNNNMFVTLFIAIVVAILISIAIAMILSRYISGMISRPMVVLADFMKVAAETGDIALREEDKALIAAIAKQRDEIGQVISSTAAFIAEINHEMDMLEKVADGDITISPNILSEKDKVGKALNKVIDSLNGMFGEINDASREVSAGSQQIASGSQKLAQGSTEQAATVQELSASISEISEKTSANAEMASKAAMLADTIKGNAEKGSKQMDDMVSAVNEISQASKSISKVIKAIDDIAFQTNILALNAAVEAARAGQHGKGFAVVADEVRSLAAKSAEAAKDTGVLISNSMEKAEYGARIANETAVSLDRKSVV